MPPPPSSVPPEAEPTIANATSDALQKQKPIQSSFSSVFFSMHDFRCEDFEYGVWKILYSSFFPESFSIRKRSFFSHAR